ncbi:DnaJ-like protein [Trinickia symbiotica]|uniref:J domain-containing protein n=1 Tax=Trinickia symbiotica TaxID=863227 RepID=A0A2N7X4R1_9BURK|nr:J domain-containing protein [Trinickia symbiotica]PMS36594.1 J domain-containing protein [Trinickia symbiotica]PPK46010.1 DnaJ-like protein [Trinickia symbiotica]
MATLYETLGVREDATDDEIKRAYRRAAMKAHPDRNVGREASAHARFQEIKEAYAILSDPVQRRVYDSVYAEEVSRLARRRDEEERLKAKREAARQAEYARFVRLAMRFAERGYNRDVLFGVLLGRDCEVELAGRIADSVAALHASRQSAPSRDANEDDRAPLDEEAVTQAAAPENPDPQSEPQSKPDTSRRDPEPTPSEDADTRGERAHANLFSTLWHGVFGLRQ